MVRARPPLQFEVLGDGGVDRDSGSWGWVMIEHHLRCRAVFRTEIEQLAYLTPKLTVERLSRMPEELKKLLLPKILFDPVGYFDLAESFHPTPSPKLIAPNPVQVADATHVRSEILVENLFRREALMGQMVQHCIADDDTIVQSHPCVAAGKRPKWPHIQRWKADHSSGASHILRRPRHTPHGLEKEVGGTVQLGAQPVERIGALRIDCDDFMRKVGVPGGHLLEVSRQPAGLAVTVKNNPSHLASVAQLLRVSRQGDASAADDAIRPLRLESQLRIAGQLEGHIAVC